MPLVCSLRSAPQVVASSSGGLTLRHQSLLRLVLICSVQASQSTGIVA